MARDEGHVTMAPCRCGAVVYVGHDLDGGLLGAEVRTVDASTEALLRVAGLGSYELSMSHDGHTWLAVRPPAAVARRLLGQDRAVYVVPEHRCDRRPS